MNWARDEVPQWKIHAIASVLPQNEKMWEQANKKARSIWKPSGEPVYFGMRKSICVVCCAIWMLAVSCGNKRDAGKNAGNDSLHATLTFSGAFALYPLVVRWTEEYHALHPNVTFDVQAGGAGKGMADALSGMVDGGMVSRPLSSEEIARGAWPLAVSSDAVVATSNVNNPYQSILYSRGVTRNQLRKVWVEGTVQSWGQLLQNSAPEKIQVFTRSDAAGAPETWARYLGSTQEDMKGIGVFGDPGLAESVAQDPLALGFNNVNYIYDGTSRRPFPEILPVPIDLDSNGTLEPHENFYSNIDSLNAAIVDGRYPSPPARLLYLVFHGTPEKAAMKKFLRWVLTDGQSFVASAGYVPLDSAQLRQALMKLE